MPSTPYHWTAALEDAFLAQLADSGSVRGAARAVGMSAKSAYARRRMHPDFAARWQSAVLSARDMLADRLLEVSFTGTDYHGVRHPVTRRLHYVRSDPMLGRGQGLGKLTRLDRLLERRLQARPAPATGGSKSTN
jgi:hypothetical protein